MKIVFLIGLVGFLAGSDIVAKDLVKKVCFDVQGMTCAGCAVTVKVAVKKLQGISSVAASLEKKDAVVEFDPSVVDEKKIKNAIDSVGYKADEKQCKV
ncbi:MAG: heavy-metal-associated domain-containing protein [Deltaproteobacteria bacterium]|nr:heavy-metal-associated domain-containing protein [Deltaproteobacteria bacterium]